MTDAKAVLAYKSLGRVERAFRTMKASDLEVRLIHQRREHRVRAHLLICILAYHVEMHMRKALAPLLFDDEDGPVRHLGTLTMNRTEPSEPDKRGFDLTSSPTPI